MQYLPTAARDLHDVSGSEPVPDPGPGTELPRLRVDLLDRWLRVALLAGLLPVLMTVGQSLASGRWTPGLMAVLGYGSFVLMACGTRLPHGLRAWGVVVTLYALGLWLLARGGSMGVMYLLGCPVAAALLLGTRHAVGLLLGCGASLLAVGTTLNPPLPAIAGLDMHTGLAWATRLLHYLSLGAVLTLSCAYLLRRMDTALARQRAVTQSLQASEATLRQITATVPGMVFRLRYDAQGNPRFIYASPGSRELLGLAPDEVCADGERVRSMVFDEDRPRLQTALQRAWRQSSTVALDLRVRLASGEQKWVHLRSTEVSHGPDGVVHNGVVMDITDRKAADARMWQQANFDALTGLPNRRMLRDQLEMALSRSRRSQRPLVLLLIDLDHFKEVNDTLGHDRGDQLLQEAARRIKACVRDSDTVARMGGDEFTVMMADVEAHTPLDLIATRILAALAEVFELGSEQAYVSGSIGIAQFPLDADTIEGLLKHADQALYAAKDGGRSRFRYFTRSLQDQAQQRMRLANDLRHALDQRQLHVVYQPIVELASGRVVKAEALLRWQHPERGAVSPAEFIPVAESTGLIGDIGDWVFHTAARQVQHWRQRVHPQFQISVNRSPVQFRNDAGQRTPWGEHLADLGLTGDAIAVEITEGLLLDTGPAVSAQLLALRDAGIPVSLDDFGTGYCSMAYLQKFDIDYLKIDRSFVSGMSQGETGRALCKAIIVMAHQLGLKVIAEGVETAEQRDWLLAAGCDHAQGWLFAKAMPPADFEAWLAERPAPVVLPPASASQAQPALDERPCIA